MSDTKNPAPSERCMDDLSLQKARRVADTVDALIDGDPLPSLRACAEFYEDMERKGKLNDEQWALLQKIRLRVAAATKEEP